MSSDKRTTFDWDPKKNKRDLEKHGVSFEFAQFAFTDPNRIILIDLSHSTEMEKRYYCLGKIGESILTVRFTYLGNVIRIFGAGYWRRGKKIYEKQNPLH